MMPKSLFFRACQSPGEVEDSKTVLIDGIWVRFWFLICSMCSIYSICSILNTRSVCSIRSICSIRSTCSICAAGRFSFKVFNIRKHNTQ
jgi:hypothetical protein